jgi:predicted nucleotidyltransferase
MGLTAQNHTRKAQILGGIADVVLLFLRIDKALLYGSRARGDAIQRSDFDIAIAAPKGDRHNGR